MAGSTLNLTRKNTVILVLGLIAICAAAFKAYSASFTHDEASSFLNYVVYRITLMSCAYNPNCWGTANNHLLNTLFMRLSSDVFGNSAFSLRLSNLTALLLYVYSAAQIVRRTSHNAVYAALGMIVLCLNPYVLDFFALARGYGLGLGLMFFSIYALIKFASSRKPIFSTISVVAACLAVFANLTYIVYMASLAAVLFTLVFPSFIKRKAIDKSWVNYALILPIVSILSTLLFFRIPIKNPWFKR